MKTTTENRVHLSKININEKLSEETLCFSADLWMDGKKMGMVSNRGMGSEHEYQLIAGADWEGFRDFCMTQPHQFDFDIEDQFIDSLLEKHQLEQALAKQAQKIKRLCLKSTVIKLPNSREYLIFKMPFSPELAHKLREKYGNDIEIFNEAAQSTTHG